MPTRTGPTPRSDTAAPVTDAGSAELLAVATAAALAGGAELRRRAGRTRLVGVKTTGTDPVTEADLASEAAVIGRIAEDRPDDGVLGEEGADRAGTTGLRWVVDPLDGTVNYLYGLPDFAVSVACELWVATDPGHRPGTSGGRWSGVVGVVHDPVRGETFTAVRGGGAHLDGSPLTVADPVETAHALVATGFGYCASSRVRQADTANRVVPAVRDVRSNGSAALSLCWVAAGRYDAFYEDELAHWDWAAGALVAREAGALVTGLGTGVLVAGPTLHERLGRLVSPLPSRQEAETTP
ncbi:inositol monophosphatase family protein [Micromonospora sp. SH-82]|uniref:inositol monophosphatase family protein n=1 Tax=Micromonospora sp. SH-82 TaxID=3132938 RepID=UPI003EB804B5